MPETKPITVEEVSLRLLETWFYLDLKTDPSFAPNYYFNNVAHLALSVLMGKAGSKIIPIEVTNSGQLKTAEAEAGYEHNYTIAKYSVADSYQLKQFPQIMSRVDITVWDKGVIIQRRPFTEAGWESAIELLPNSFYSFDCSTEALYIKNATAGQTAQCQAVGWY